MIVESYYYGPKGNGGITLETTANLRRMVKEDLIQELYTMDAPRHVTRQFDKVYQTKQGPVIGVTRISPVQSHDGRSTIINKTLFVRYSDFIKDLSRLLDEPVSFPLSSLNVKLCKT
jgi:hypothetical protein